MWACPLPLKKQGSKITLESNQSTNKLLLHLQKVSKYPKKQNLQRCNHTLEGFKMQQQALLLFRFFAICKNLTHFLPL